MAEEPLERRQYRGANSKVAVRVGFEPTEPAKVQRFSRPPDSTTLAPHRTSNLPDFHHLRKLNVVCSNVWSAVTFLSNLKVSDVSMPVNMG